ncbi:MAG: DUF2231 domain-containing protein [Acidobacteriota bacterium]
MPMSLIGKLHPLIVHFPIALVLAAAATELVAVATRCPVWRAVALANVRVGAVIGIVTVITGWQFATSPIVDIGPALEWHRWVGMAGVLAALIAVLMSSRLHLASRGSVFAYRATLFGAALLVGIAGHLGGVLVWGDGFLRP